MIRNESGSGDRVFVMELLAEKSRVFVEQVRRLRHEWTPDAIHDMRVACRRLRCVFATFDPFLDQEFARGSKKTLKKFMRAFNALRDCDVQVGMLAELAAPPSVKVNAQVQPLMKRFSSRQQTLGQKAKKLLEEHQTALELAFSGMPPGVSVGGEGQLLEMLVPEIDRTVSAWRAVTWKKPAETMTSLHVLRIQIKRIRYGMELLVSRIGGGAKKTLKILGTLQDVLGRIHDCDMLGLELKRSLVQTLEKQHSASRKLMKKCPWSGLTTSFTRKLYRDSFPEPTGILFLLRAIRKQRKKLFLEIREKLGSPETAGWHSDLMKLLKMERTKTTVVSES